MIVKLYTDLLNQLIGVFFTQILYYCWFKLVIQRTNVFLKLLIPFSSQKLFKTNCFQNKTHVKKMFVKIF